MSESKWLSSLRPYIDEYDESLSDATESYAHKIISAFKISEDLGINATNLWGLSIDSACINDVTHAVSSAYMSGKAQANRTLPDMPPHTGFRSDDMANINRLRDFNQEEISKFANDFRVRMKLRALERQSREKVIENIRTDLESMMPKIGRIAGTEIYRAANDARVREYSYRGVVEVKWVSLGGCARCQSLHGKLMFMSEVPPLPHHPNCTCTVVAVR
jgi:hypothetical protein